MRNFTQTWQTNWTKKLNKYVPLLAVMVIFGSLGTTLYLTSHAATPTANAETENGTISSAASNVTDSTASGGHAVKFGSGGGGSTGTCTSWPDASCTGVPAGTTLTAYTGPMTITTAGTVIQNKTISTNHGKLDIEASNVVIRNTQILGTEVYINNDPGTLHGVVLDHVTVDGQGKGSTTNNDYAVGGGYGGGFELAYSDISGWDTGVMINSEPATVYVHDNYIHDLGPASDVHKTALSSNGGGGDARVIHNNLDCGVSGCSAAMSLYGDFATISDWDVENNLFNTEGSYCSYEGTLPKAYPNADHVIWKNNAYGKQYHPTCGIYGASDGWGDGGGTNVWSGNYWLDTGAAVDP